MKHVKKNAIASGTYGKIYLTRDYSTVCKVIDNSPLYGIDNSSLRETSSLRTLRDSPHIVKVRDIKSSLEYVEIYEKKYPMDLYHYLKKHGTIESEQIKHIIREILIAINASHHNHIINCDVKPSNILLDPNGHIFVCDWGLGLYVSKYDFGVSSAHIVQTYAYRAPEVICQIGYYTFKIDVWSIGIILCELIKGKILFGTSKGEYDSTHQLDSIFNTFGFPDREMWGDLYNTKNFTYNGNFYRTKRTLSKVIDTDEVCLDLIDKLTQYDPLKRCSCKDALQHPYFNGIIMSPINTNIMSNIEHIDPLIYASESGFTDKDRTNVLMNVLSILSGLSAPNIIYFAGVFYFDMYLTGNKVSKKNLLIVCLCCMLISSKVNDAICLPIHKMMKYVNDNTITNDTIRTLELNIVTYLDYSLFYTNVHHVVIYHLKKYQVGIDKMPTIINKCCKLVYNANFYKYDIEDLVIALILHNLEKDMSGCNEQVVNMVRSL